MNLIEQLGGHEKAKRELELKEQNSILQCCIAVTAEMIRDALLEYRRQQNIYEESDVAVNRRGEESRLLKIWRVDICPADKRMSIADYDADGLAGWSRFHCLRHATDEETSDQT